MATPQFKIQLDTGATLPTRAHASDIGYDLTAATYGDVTLINGDVHPLDIMIEAGSFREFSPRNIAFILLDTGIHITPPKGYYVEIAPNSRLAKTPFVFGNSIGIIDPDYTGSIKIALTATRPCDYNDLLALTPGNTIGQLIIRKKHDADWQLVDQLTPTQRGSGGFGSTANIAKSAQ